MSSTPVPPIRSSKTFNPPRAHGWHGVPGARHIPPAEAPSFGAFVDTVAEWKLAGVEMTDEIMRAIRQVSELQVQRAEERQKVERLAEERLAAVVHLEPAPPGAFGDAPGGVVYYARRGQYVKIGTTMKLRPRMRDILPDELMAVEPGSYTLERQLHQRFADLRVTPSLEYFHLRGEVAAHISDVRQRCGAPPSGLTFEDCMSQ